MAALSNLQLNLLATKYFGDLGPEWVKWAVETAKAESSADASAIGDNFKSGHQSATSPARYDYGLMQVNSQHGFDSKKLTSDPEYNMAAARKIFDAQGYKAWATHKTVVPKVFGEGGGVPEEEESGGGFGGLLGRFGAALGGAVGDVASNPTRLLAGLGGAPAVLGAAQLFGGGGTTPTVPTAPTGGIGTGDAGIFGGPDILIAQSLIDAGIKPTPEAIARYRPQVAQALTQGGVSTQEVYGSLQELLTQDASDPSLGSILQRSDPATAGDPRQQLLDAGYIEIEPGLFVDPIGGARIDTRPGANPVGSDSGGRTLFPEEREQISLQNEQLRRALAENPNLQFVTDDRTGDSYLLDTQTGERTSVGQFGFGGVDPQSRFALDAALGLGGLDVSRQRLGLDTELGRGRLAQDEKFGTAAEDRLRAGLGLDRDVSQGQLDLGAAGEDRLRRSLEQEAQTTNQAADFGRFDRLTDVLRNPADFLARAFLSRGQQPPGGQITQADLLNSLRSEIRDVGAPQFEQGTPRPQLSPLDFTQFSGGGAGPAAPTPAPATAPVGGGPGISAQPMAQVFRGENDPLESRLAASLAASGAPAMGGLTAGFAELQEIANRQRLQAETTGRTINPQGQPIRKAAKGGTGIKNRFSLVGERGPELLIHNKDGSFDVIPNDLLADDVVDRADKTGVSRFQFGTINQTDIANMSRLFAPPAVRSILEDKPIAPLQFDFPVPSPQSTAKLTPDETTALGTSLAAEFNASLSDVVASQRQRFLGTSGQRARFKF